MATPGTLSTGASPTARARRAGDAGELPAGMSVRPLERADLPGVAALVRESLRVGPPDTEPALARFFGRTLLDQPWADPEIPPLVAVDERGLAVGFVAAEVRRMRLDNRTLRFAWAAHTAIAPAARAHAVGLLLMRRLLEGAQDATLGDSASPLMEQMWLRLGGRRLELKAIHWVRVFRPARVAAHVVAPRRTRLQRGLCVLADGLDSVTRPVLRRAVQPPPRPSAAEIPLTARAVVEDMPRVAREAMLRPAYDERFLDWLLGELPRATRRGELVARLVRDRRDRTVGWYVYFLRPGGRSEVLQVAASGERALGTVLDRLFDHACAHGSAALRGRLEPGMLAALTKRRCLLWYRGASVAHAHDPGVMAAIESPNALISRLDGDPWVDTLVDGAA
jgi:hypothetical protein